jgi:hypothetical protein
MRYCKTCKFCKKTPNLDNSFKCTYKPDQSNWPWFMPLPLPAILAPRHVVEGGGYVEVFGSTKDWTEVMDCAVWENKENYYD